MEQLNSQTTSIPAPQMTDYVKWLSEDRERCRKNFLSALLNGDRQRARQYFEAWLHSGLPLKTIYHDLIQQSLYEVGKLWENGKISVAVEHLATAIAESLLNLVYPVLFNQPRIGKTAVVSCSANEYHQIGGKMVADIFELNGWRGYFLGANTPMQDLLRLTDDQKPNVVALSLTLHHSLNTLIKTVESIRDRHAMLPILVGGQAFVFGGRDQVERIPGVKVILTLSELESWIKQN